MINIGENNQISYRRNRNFSSTIVLEMEQSATKEKECIGVVFDVDTSNNEIGRLFFWHKGGMIPGDYRTGERTMTTSEVREYLQKHFPKEEYFYTSNNERFRRNLYDVYLGGLDMEKFPRLFKRAIPFRMNIRLEDFVKEYICMEQDIHIEDMQESDAALWPHVPENRGRHAGNPGAGPGRGAVSGLCRGAGEAGRARLPAGEA